MSKEFITFNMPSLTGKEEWYISQALNSKKISGDGFFGIKCLFWLEEYFGFKKTLFNPSCIAALETERLV